MELKRINEIDSMFKKSSPIYSVPITVKSLESHNNINDVDF